MTLPSNNKLTIESIAFSEARNDCALDVRFLHGNSITPDENEILVHILSVSLVPV